MKQEIEAEADASEPFPLSDPISFGEDLRHIAARAMQLAPIHCGACEDYHLIAPLKRLAADAGSAGIDVDRTHLVRLVSEILRNRAPSSEHPARVVILGSVDTGQLSTCAHAALVAGRDVLANTHFTVLDLCQTPLLLCREFAAKHRLTLVTEIADLVKTPKTYPADILFIHSLFRHFPAESHAAILRKFGKWLKPDGKIIFSNSLRPLTEEYIESHRHADASDRARRFVEAGSIDVEGAKEQLYARLERRVSRRKQRPDTEFQTLEDLRALFAAADMLVMRLDRVSKIQSMTDGRKAARERAVAVIQPASSA